MLFQNYVFVKSLAEIKNLRVNLVTSFSRQKPLKLKNKNHTVVSYTKIYHSTNFELKWMKTANVTPRVPFQAFC